MERERERESGENVQDVGIQRYISEEEGRVSGIRLQPPMQDPSMTHYKDGYYKGSHTLVGRCYHEYTNWWVYGQK